MREHKQEKEQDREQEGGAENTPIPAAAMQQIAQTRTYLISKAKEAAHAVTMGANVFQMAVRGMDEEKLHEKLSDAAAESLKDGVIDRLWDTMKEHISEGAEIGLNVVENSSVVFSSMKDAISGHIAAKKQLTVLEVADSITAAMISKSFLLEEALRTAIYAIPARKMLLVRNSLRELHGKGNKNDSKENGFIADGMKDEYVADLGMPRGDMVAAEEYATKAFSAFQMGVINTMPAHEAGDAVQKRLKNPEGDKEAVEATEKERMGEEYNEQLGKDRNMRGRVETETAQ